MIEIMIVLLLRPAVERPAFKPEDLLQQASGHALRQAKINQGRDFMPPASEAKEKGLHQ